MKYNPKQRRKLRSTKAYNNNTFLNSREARSLRIQCEMIEPGIRLKRLGVEHMITFFGSARPEEDNQNYIDARMLAKMLGETEGCNGDVGISSGGGPGIMEAVNRGAREGGAKSIGMGISLPFEQRNNEYVSSDLDFEFHYFFTRKYWCVYLTKAYVIMPGGVGTLDELFEILTLIQTQKMPAVPIVLFNSDFWNRVIDFDVMIKYGTISPEDVDLFKITDDYDEAVDYIIDNIDLSPRKGSICAK